MFKKERVRHTAILGKTTKKVGEKGNNLETGRHVPFHLKRKVTKSWEKTGRRRGLQIRKRKKKGGHSIQNYE